MTDSEVRAFPQIERLLEFIRMVREWTAKFPLKGEASDQDHAAAVDIYCCCEGAEENISELRQLIAYGSEREQAGRRAGLDIILEEIASSTGPTGGWLDSPKAFAAAIRERLK